MRRFFAGLIELVNLPMLVLGLGLLFVADGQDAVLAVPPLVIGAGLTVIWWLLVGRDDPGAPYISAGQNLMGTLAGTWGASLIVFGFLWLIVARGLARSAGLVWIGAGFALLRVWWGLLGRYGDDE